jgi:NTE family protein
MFGRPSNKTISLALQGGGAHGAFTWGVLDALLEDGRLDFEALSGTSAGAMNAVVCAHGMLTGGRDGAREALELFWTSVSSRVPFDFTAGGSADQVSLSPAARMLMHWSRYFSPYQLNPFDLNPLRDIITEQVDFKRLRRKSPIRLFIAATHANSGKLRLFHNKELTPEMLLASACLPTLHHTVDIGGEPYWDGGYSANPAVFPLFYECASRDVLLVLLSPLQHESTPRSAEEIQTRALELAFSANFMREMRMFVHARDFASSGVVKLGRLERRLAGMRFHMVEANDVLSKLGSESKLIAHEPFLLALRDAGRERTQAWLKKNRSAIGSRSSVDMEKHFS